MDFIWRVRNIAMNSFHWIVFIVLAWLYFMFRLDCCKDCCQYAEDRGQGGGGIFYISSYLVMSSQLTSSLAHNITDFRIYHHTTTTTTTTMIINKTHQRSPAVSYCVLIVLLCKLQYSNSTSSGSSEVSSDIKQKQNCFSQKLFSINCAVCVCSSVVWGSG